MVEMKIHVFQDVCQQLQSGIKYMHFLLVTKFVGLKQIIDIDRNILHYFHV